MLDQEYLVVSNNYVWEENGKLIVTGGADTRILVYPELTEIPSGFERFGEEGRFSAYERILSRREAKAEFQEVSRGEERVLYEITVSYPEREDRLTGRDTLLWLSYSGNSMEIYLGKEKINDHFYTGQKVPVSLGYFGFPEKLQVAVNVLKKEDRVFIEKWPLLTEGSACSLDQVEITEEYR